MADSTFNLDELVADLTEGEDTSTTVTQVDGAAATTKSKSGC